jgi:hypothetical protein
MVLLLLEKPADVELLLLVELSPLLLLLPLLLVVAVVLRLLVGGRLLLLVLACVVPHIGVLVLLVLLQRVMLLYVLVLVGYPRLLFQLGDSGGSTCVVACGGVGAMVDACGDVSRSTVTTIQGGRRAATGGVALASFGSVAAAATSGGATCGAFAAASVGFRPFASARTNGHRDAGCRAADGVVVRVVVATGDGSRHAIARGGAGGADATSGATCAKWHHVVAIVALVGGLCRVVGGGDGAIAIHVVAGTTIAWLAADWRAVVGIRRQRAATCGAVIGVDTNVGGLRTPAVGDIDVAATSGANDATWRQADDVVTDVGGLRFVVVVVSGGADGVVVVGGVVDGIVVAYVDASWRPVVSIRRLRATNGGDVIGDAINASGQRVAPGGAYGSVAATSEATIVGWRKAVVVNAHVVGFALLLLWVLLLVLFMVIWLHVLMLLSGRLVL